MRHWAAASDGGGRSAGHDGCGVRAKTSKAPARRAAGTPKPRTPGASARPLLADVRGLIVAARERVARTVNASLVMLDWALGRRIRPDLLRENRAAEAAEQRRARTAT